MISISNFKEILTSKTGGKPVSKIPNFYAVCYEAMIAMKGKTDIPSAIRTAQLANPIYSNVHNYPIPSDVALDAVIAVRPLDTEKIHRDFFRTQQREMNTKMECFPKHKYAIKNLNGQQTLLINADTTAPVVINQCDSLTENGAVTGFGGADQIRIDTLQKVSGTGAIAFRATNNSGIEISGMESVDLSSQNDILANVYLPVTVTSLNLSLGTDGSNYFVASVNQDFFGNAFSLGWNLIKLPKSTFTITGAPSGWGDITYLKYEVNGAISTVDGFRLDVVTAQVGAIYEMDYYSSLQFQTVAGVRISKPQMDSDYIIITDEELNLYLGYFMSIIAVDLKQIGAEMDLKQYGGQNLTISTEEFKIKYPSQRQLPQVQYGGNPYIR